MKESGSEDYLQSQHPEDLLLLLCTGDILTDTQVSRPALISNYAPGIVTRH